MNQQALKQILPHRDNMLLLDEAWVEEGTAKGVLKINPDQWFLKGHFPNNPVVPGVILCEIMAQSVCVLLSSEMQGSSITPYFTGLDKVRFRSPVHGGDVFRTECEITKAKPPFYWAQGKGYVGDKLCVSGGFSFALMENTSPEMEGAV